MTEPLYMPIPGQPPCWLRPREPENERRHLEQMMALEKLQREWERRREGRQ